MRLSVLALTILIIAVVPVSFVHGTSATQPFASAAVNNATAINGIVQRAFGIIAGIS